jgi:hypothetical protein
MFLFIDNAAQQRYVTKGYQLQNDIPRLWHGKVLQIHAAEFTESWRRMYIQNNKFGARRSCVTRRA